MPIQVTCPTCRGTFAAPDTAAGKRAKCPTCGGAIDIPASGHAEILEAEPVAAMTEAVASGDRKPCPMCGEMIQKNALKCRFCGEIFDPLLAKEALRGGLVSGETVGDPQDKTNAIVIFVTSILGCFSPIVAIYGIVFLLRRPYSFPYKGLAIAGTVIHCIWTAFLIMSIAAGALQQ